MACFRCFWICSVIVLLVGIAVRIGWNGVSKHTFSVNYEAAQNGDAEAQHNLGLFYETGFGVAKDERLAVEWYTKAADQGYADGLFRLGRCYHDGVGVEKDLKRGLELYTEAANRGSVVARLALAPQTATAVPLIVELTIQATKENNATAQLLLGVFHLKGTLVEKNQQRGIELISMAAEQGLANAQAVMAEQYESGIGVPKDPHLAEMWYTKAADQESAEAQARLGYHYLSSGNADKFELAVMWLTKAAQQGHGLGMFLLGYCYEHGLGLRDGKNENLAAEFYTKAAEKGLDEAQFALGRCYENGVGVDKDEQRAVQLYKLAATQGHAKAKARLAVLS